MSFINWWHHLTDPHCAECAEEKSCKSCETFKTELASLRFTNEHLLKSLLEQFAPKPIQAISEEIKLPISNKNIPWNVRKQMLEAESRQEARLIQEKMKEQNESKKTTEQLEQELLGEQNG